jgi:hypothetical protein
MLYLAGTKIAGPFLRRWACDRCPATCTVENEEDERMAHAVGWRAILNLVHLCPAHSDGPRG